METLCDESQGRAGIVSESTNSMLSSCLLLVQVEDEVARSGCKAVQSRERSSGGILLLADSTRHSKFERTVELVNVIKLVPLKLWSYGGV